MAHERSEELCDTSTEIRIEHQTVAAYRITGQRYPYGGFFDDGGADVAQHGRKRRLRVRPPTLSGDIDPSDGLP